jgi:hypothetical protein
MTRVLFDRPITNDKKSLILTIVLYAFMYEEQAKGREIEAGIISFKNLKTGFLPFNFKQDKEVTDVISPEIMENYLEQIVVLLLEIFNIEMPFEEKIN